MSDMKKKNNLYLRLVLRLIFDCAGSSNSQESFPSGGGGGAPMDGYGAQYAGYPPQPNHTQGNYYTIAPLGNT